MSMMPPAGARVAIYARYSTNMQTFKSIEDQIAICRAYAEKQGWDVVAAYYDAERSGTTLVGRDGFFQMMAGAERAEFVVVVVEDVDRLSRNAADTHSLFQELDDLDITVCTVSSGMVSETELAFKAVQNSQYVKQLGQKTRRGQEGTVRSGRISGSVAYGYKKAFLPDGKNGHRVIDDEEARTVRRIFEMYAAGMSTIDICRKLNAERVPGPRNHEWSPGALTGSKVFATGILRNKTYAGKFEWGRTSRKRNARSGKLKTKATATADRIVSERPDLRIIDDALFEQVQARLEKRANTHFGEYRTPDYLFTGKTVCGVCGGSSVLLNKRIGCSGHAKRGTCSNKRRVKREDLEQAVLNGLSDHLLKPEIIDACIADYRAELERAVAEQQARSTFRAGRLDELEKQISNVMAQVRSGASGLAAQMLTQELERLGHEQQQLQREARTAPEIIPLDLNGVAIVGRLKALIGDLRSALEKEDQEAVRARDIIRSMIDRIVITPIDDGKADGRGAGDVRVTVEGALSRLLEFAEEKVGRAILHGSRTKTMQGVSNLEFRFDVVIVYENPRLINGGYADLAIVARMLDDADAPVTNTALREALEKTPLPEGAKTINAADRVRRALTYLEDRGEIRAVRFHRSSTGWVWNRAPMTDEDWKERIRTDRPPGHQMPVLRILAPEATPVIVTRGAS